MNKKLSIWRVFVIHPIMILILGASLIQFVRGIAWYAFLILPISTYFVVLGNMEILRYVKLGDYTAFFAPFKAIGGYTRRSWEWIVGCVERSWEWVLQGLERLGREMTPLVAMSLSINSLLFIATVWAVSLLDNSENKILGVVVFLPSFYFIFASTRWMADKFDLRLKIHLIDGVSPFLYEGYIVWTTWDDARLRANVHFYKGKTLIDTVSFNAYEMADMDPATDRMQLVWERFCERNKSERMRMGK